MRARRARLPIAAQEQDEPELPEGEGRQKLCPVRLPDSGRRVLSLEITLPARLIVASARVRATIHGSQLGRHRPRQAKADEQARERDGGAHHAPFGGRLHGSGGYLS